jgi:hypothetical protein
VIYAENTENRIDDVEVCTVGSMQLMHILSFFFSHFVLLSELKPSMNKNSRFNEK